MSVKDANQCFRESGPRRLLCIAQLCEPFVLVLCTWVHVYFTEILLCHVVYAAGLVFSQWSKMKQLSHCREPLGDPSGFHGILWFLLQWAPVFNMKPQEGSKVQRIWNTSLILKYFHVSAGEGGGCAVREHKVQQNNFPFIIFEAPVHQRVCSGLLLNICSLIAVF